MNQFQSWYYRQPQALRTIITINVVVYVAAQFISPDMAGLWPTGFEFVMEHFALHPIFPDILFEPWQLVTYNFMHTSGGLWGLLHIGFNMLWLFWIGKEFERMHGRQQFWTVYLVTGIGGGLLCLILAQVFPEIAGGMINGHDVPVIGASASVLGVIMAVAILYPYKQIGLLFFGVVRLLYVVVGFLVVDAILMLDGGGGTAVAAHWGGALSGFLYAKGVRGEIGLPSWLSGLFRTGSGSRRSRQRSPSRVPTLFERIKNFFGGGTSDSSGDSGSRPRPPSADGAQSRSSPSGSRKNPQSKELDRILDKISAEGYESLSDEEKKTLYEASQS